MARSSGCCWRPAWTRPLANIIQTLLYALTTRLGAPGRDRYLLVLTLGHGLPRRLADGGDRRDRGRVPRPRDHAVRGLPVHRAYGPDQAARPRGRGDRPQAPATARRLAGHRVTGVRHARAGERIGAGDGGRPSAGRALRPYPVLRVALPVLRLRRLHGRRDARPAAPGSARSSRRSLAEIELRADALDAASRGCPATPDRVPRRRHAVAAPDATPSPRSSGRSGNASGSPRTPRSRSRPTRAPTSAAIRRALRRAGVTRISFGAQSLDDAELRRLGRRHRARRRRRCGCRRSRGGHRVDQRRPPLRHPRRHRRDLDGHARRGARPGARPPGALRA